MLLIFCPDPRPGHRHGVLLARTLAYSNFKRQMYAKKEGKKQERNVEKRSKTNTQQDQVEDRLKISLTLSLSVALTVAARQPPLWPGQDNRAQAAPKTKPNRNSTKTRASLCHLALLCTLFKYLRSFTIFMTAKNITTPTLARRRRHWWWRGHLTLQHRARKRGREREGERERLSKQLLA